MPLIDYKIGKISLSQGSTLVRGTDTYWIGRVNPGDWLYINMPDNTGWYEILEVNSNTEAILRDTYTGDSLVNANYLVTRNPDRAITAELARTQLKILDDQVELEQRFDGMDEKIEQAETAATEAKYYAGVATSASSTAVVYMNKAISASQTAQMEASNAFNYRNEAAGYAQTAKEQAEISTEQAEVSTTQAGVSTTQADRAEQIVEDFINGGNQAGGAVIVGADGKIPTDLMPGAVKDVKSFDTIDNFPRPGESGFIYLALDTHRVYLWAGEPANDYVPVDTTLALAGTGTAETAARSDHNHDKIYEPYRNMSWCGTIDPQKINIDQAYIKEGFYGLMPETEGEYYKGIIGFYQKVFDILVFYLFRKKISVEGTRESYMDVGYGVIDGTLNFTAFTRIVDFEYDEDSGSFTTNGNNIWQGLTSITSVAWNGRFSEFVKEYDPYNRDPDTIYFVEEAGEGKANFAIKTINHQYPDGTGNIDIEGASTLAVTVSESASLFSDANNIRSNNSYHITIGDGITTSNYPSSDKIFLARVNSTLSPEGKIQSVFQDFFAIDTSGTVKEFFRYGQNNGSDSYVFSAWTQLK